jgi:uncharacterized LabA/DUF88 family protein
MQRVAAFVDAGYVYAQSAVCLTGANVNRAQLKLDEAEFINQIKSLALTLGAGAQLLRVYWYDGAKNGLTVEQLVLADMQDVKVRLGSINSAGQQKGVDSLLVTDLIDLARNQAIADAVVVTGDGDMRIAVQIAQSFGVRVHLVGLEPSRASQSQLLRQEADTVHEVSKDDVRKFMRHSGPLTPAPQLGPQAGMIVEENLSFDLAVQRSIDTHLSQISDAEMNDLRQVTADTRRVPEQYDRRILGTCGALLKRKMSDEECRVMRKRAIDYINRG